MKTLFITSLLVICLYSGGCQNKKANNMNSEQIPDSMKVIKTDSEWKLLLTDEQYRVTRQSGTERAFTGKYTDVFEKGAYYCICCRTELFKSDTKFHSSCGWPSFYDKSKPNNIVEVLDKSYGMLRTEVRCAVCDAHLGHIFSDGPAPTGLRYCINSASLIFKQDSTQ